MDLLTLFVIFILIVLTILSIKKQITENFNQQNPYLNDIVEEIIDTYPHMKNLRFYEGDKSFTINKEKVFICMKNKQNGHYYDREILKYVILHEYAHSICPEIGHTDLFFKMFDEIIQDAISKGLYNADIEVPDNYCE